MIEDVKKIDTKGVEILAQTMAPFPWHFGGQRYQNLFVKPKDIVNRCNKNNIKICLDVSHTFLTCNYFNLNFYDEVDRLLPFVKYVHMGDASGINGEGLQIGKGEINLSKLWTILKKINAPFIPEIWQGHMDQGNGFAFALKELEKIE